MWFNRGIRKACMLHAPSLWQAGRLGHLLGYDSFTTWIWKCHGSSPAELQYDYRIIWVCLHNLECICINPFIIKQRSLHIKAKVSSFGKFIERKICTGFCLKDRVLWILKALWFVAHLSRWLKWAIAVCFCPSSVNFLHFHLLLKNVWLDFNQTWQESSFGVGDSKLFKWCVWPVWGPRERASKGQNCANFKHLLLQIQKKNSQVI